MKAGLIGMGIKYRDGYDGQLAEEDVHVQLPKELWPPEPIEGPNEFIFIDTSGIMTIKVKYAWDYASVPITHKFSNWFQGKKSKVPSLIHDALCQCERAGLMKAVPDARKHADKFFYELLIERGFWKWRARMWYRGVRVGSKGKSSNKPILIAP